MEKLANFSFCFETSFSKTSIGQFIIFTELIIGCIFVLAIEIMVSLISIYYFRKYIDHKLAFINLYPHQRTSRYSFCDTREVFEFSFINNIDNTVLNNRMINELAYKTNTNLTRMTIFFCFFSTIINIFSVIVFFIYIFVINMKGDIGVLAASSVLFNKLGYLIKFGGNFFFLILFDKNFRHAFRKAFIFWFHCFYVK